MKTEYQEGYLKALDDVKGILGEVYGDKHPHKRLKIRMKISKLAWGVYDR